MPQTREDGMFVLLELIACPELEFFLRYAAKESIGSKGFMKRSKEGRIVASGVASRLKKHQQKLPTQQESCASNSLATTEATHTANGAAHAAFLCQQSCLRSK
ncbi:hypothetical protein PIB30_085184 [Stylosanthes scabra]|uniref:Uncharacterized protein n=1 Tax=Stylosanthes scabra TaxID=79078 RepID=A0ABU6TTD0_9FABA|nr:hypothetical protein [Stylosanthes scabra]